MSIAFADSGMVTRGMGSGHRILTRGMGRMNFDWGGVRRRSEKDYMFDMFMPVSKTESMQVGIYSPLVREILMNTVISKELNKDIGVTAGVDHGKLSRILDAI